MDLGTLAGGTHGGGIAINDRGEVAGNAVAAGGHGRAFVWAHARMTDLGTLGGMESVSAAINRHGQVTGRAWTATDGVVHTFVSCPHVSVA